MFQKAIRQKVRFNTVQGQLTVEDLWEIPLTSNKPVANLDDIAKSLFQQLKESDSASFVLKNKPADDTLLLKFEIVKHVIEVRLAEAEKAETIKVNREKKQRILAIIATKENEQLMGSSLDELRSMMESL